MESSYKFKYIEENLIKLVGILLQNENLKKYIIHLTDDPLSEPNVTEDLIESRNIILAPFDDRILTEEKVILFVNPLRGNLNNQPLSDLIFLVDIIIPTSKWLLNGLGQIRAFRIADLIARDVDQKRIMGVKENEVTEFRIFKVNNNYSGLSLTIKVNSSSMKGLM